MRALHFPRATLPLASTVMELQQLLVAMVVLGAIVLGTGEPLTPSWLLVVPALALQTVFNSGLALALARVTSRVRDLEQLLPFALRTWLYASGVFFVLEQRRPHRASARAHPAGGQPGRGLHRAGPGRADGLPPGAAPRVGCWARDGPWSRSPRGSSTSGAPRNGTDVAEARTTYDVAVPAAREVEPVPTVVVDDLHVVYRVARGGAGGNAGGGPAAAGPGPSPPARQPGPRGARA